MVTLMTHFQIDVRTVRHQGAWRKADEAMPDLYLRDSQVLVVAAQVRVLDQVRKGVVVQILEGRPINEKLVQVTAPAEGSAGESAWSILGGGIPGEDPEKFAQAMSEAQVALPGVSPGSPDPAAMVESMTLAADFLPGPVLPAVPG